MPVNRYNKKTMGMSALLMAGLVFIELAVYGFNPDTHGLTRITVIRCIQLVMLSSAAFMSATLARLLSADPADVRRGMRIGALWSVIVGFLASTAGMMLYLAGTNPLALIRLNVPTEPADLFLLYLTGGLIGPMVEELVFRGMLFSLLRPFGAGFAIFLSALIFAGFHLPQTPFPVIPFIGGLVFAASLERSGSIAAPLIIHCLGNLTLFSLSVQSWVR